MWKERCFEIKQKRTESITIEDVNKDFLDTVCYSWENLCNDLKSGDITFLDFENHFSEIEKTEIIRELNFIAEIFCMRDNNWIVERLSQYQQYKVLKECVHVAKVIIEFARQFELHGNFQQVQEMMRLVCIF